ncbi:MAG: hypothetical protein U0237_02815 [Thermoleophilia bacterium]
MCSPPRAGRASPLWLLALPVLVLVPPWFAIRDDMSGQNALGFLVMFLLGFAVAGAGTPESTLQRHWPWILGLGAAASAAQSSSWSPRTGDAPDGAAALAGVKSLYELGVWAVILGLLGAARRFADRGGVAWRYASRPRTCSVLHQTVIVAIAYEVVRWDVPPVLDYAVIAVASTMATVVVYELAVRRWAAVRVLRHAALSPGGRGPPDRDRLSTGRPTPPATRRRRG